MSNQGSVYLLPQEASVTHPDPGVSRVDQTPDFPCLFADTVDMVSLERVSESFSSSRHRGIVLTPREVSVRGDRGAANARG